MSKEVCLPVCHCTLWRKAVSDGVGVGGGGGAMVAAAAAEAAAAAARARAKEGCRSCRRGAGAHAVSPLNGWILSGRRCSLADD